MGRRCSTNKVDNERVLNLWAQDLKGAVIAERMGCTQTAIYQIIERARKAGDKRATGRHK